MSLFVELKRRNVFRVGAAYIVASWLLAQVVQLAAESFEAPAWIMKMLITVLVIGLPLALFFSWAYEITPEGIKKESEVNREHSITHETARKLDFLTMALLIAVALFVVLDRFVLEQPVPPAPAQQAIQVAEPVPVVPDIEENSIAVLPFVNMSADPEQEYFSDGIAEELLNLLVRVEGLKVASRTSSFAYKDETVNIPQIARELKVANILEGSVRKAGNRVRITAQLIDTRNDRHLWSDSYDRDLDDIFAIQDEIANAIVNALRTELGLDLAVNAVSVTADTDNLDAYDLFLKAHGLLIARKDLDQAVLFLEQAVELDPKFARAWADLGAAAWVAPAWNYNVRDYLATANMAIDKALELDDDLSMAWAVRAQLLQDNRDYELSMDYLNTAIEKDRLNTTAWLWRGVTWSELGFHDRALADIAQCLEIDPAYGNCLLHTGMLHILKGNHEGVRQNFAKLARNNFLTYMAYHVPYLVDRGDMLGATLAAYQVSRHPDYPAMEWIEALEYPDRDYGDSVTQAHVWLQEETRAGMNPALMLAFGAYDRLIIEPGLVANWIWQPAFPEFRKSKAFKRIVKELNLDSYWRAREFPPQCRPLGDEDFTCE